MYIRKKKNLLKRLQWHYTNQYVCLATNEAALMVGCHCGYTIVWDMMFPLGFHCTCILSIVYGKTLFASDGCKTILELLILIQFVNKFYEWLQGIAVDKRLQAESYICASSCK